MQHRACALALTLLAAGCAPLPPAPEALPSADLSPVPAQPKPQGLATDWHQGAFMEIFVRGYQDSDGDGVGDLPGLISRLDYLKELGITGLFPAFADRVEYRADVGGGLTEHEVVDIFVADVTPGMTLQPNPDEVAEVAWVDLYDLSADTARNPDKYTPWLRIYMAEHMGRIFGAAVR